jgi:hypothetical protein
MTLRSYPLGSLCPTQYETLTEAERLAWHNPIALGYHSYHVERMGWDTFRFRDSRTTTFYIGTYAEVAEALLKLTCRLPDTERLNQVQVLRILSQSEIDDLLGDL